MRKSKDGWASHTGSPSIMKGLLRFCFVKPRPYDIVRDNALIKAGA